MVPREESASDSGTSFAGHDGVDTLYRFMRFPSADAGSMHRGWATGLIQRGELYFPLAHELNDPFEASPHLRIPQTLDELLQGFASWATQHRMTQESIVRQAAELASTFHSGRYQAEAEMALLKYRPVFRTNVPICSFAATRESTLLWSYYAEGHKGLCVHFASREPSPFATAQRVTYREQYPTVPVPIGDQGGEFLRAAFLTKSKSWAHEREYRLINLPSDGAAPNSAHIYDDIFNWRAPQLAVLKSLRDITGVTVGACMASNEIEQVLRACHDRVPSITNVEQAKPKAEAFELDFVELRS